MFKTNTQNKKVWNIFEKAILKQNTSIIDSVEFILKVIVIIVGMQEARLWYLLQRTK